MELKSDPITVPHMRNAVSKIMRENWPAHHENNAQVRAATHTFAAIALDFATWFKKHDDSFDHLAWLDSLTPYPDLYPLSELWEATHVPSS